MLGYFLKSTCDVMIMATKTKYAYNSLLYTNKVLANHVEYFGHLRRFGHLGQRAILHIM